MAIGALQTAAWPPLRVPEDISIVGFDGKSFSALATPSLSTVAQPTYRHGRLAASLVLRPRRGLLTGPGRPPLRADA
jgi:DNA-binding LacI/PurR family transcriptional regulator